VKRSYHARVPGRLSELARVFLKLGTISFGGPAAHIALMRDECVTRRRWLTDRAFLDLVGATNIIPGPNSTEMAIHIGRLRGGVPGLLVAGACFILPAMLIVLAFAVGYVRFGALPELQAVFYGLKPVVLAIIVYAVLQLGRTAIRVRWHAAVGLAAVATSILGIHELVTLAACGTAGAAVRAVVRRGEQDASAGAWVPIALPIAAMVPVPISLGTLFQVFFKAGALLFGSGYVLIAFLRSDLVERLHWLTEQQLVDAIAVGQFTPGPVFTTATFIGFVLGGTPGAVVATGAIFLPAFVYVAVTAPILPALRRSSVLAGALDGVNIASLALMAVTAAQLARAAVVDPLTAAVAIGAFAVLLLRRANPAWLMAAGAAAGIAAMLVGS
jgi:chromate transporter